MYSYHLYYLQEWACLQVKLTMNAIWVVKSTQNKKKIGPILREWDELVPLLCYDYCYIFSSGLKILIHGFLTSRLFLSYSFLMTFI